MTERLAVHLLWNYFYEIIPSKVFPKERILMFRNEAGKLVLPTQADKDEMQRHRDKLIGKDFRFTWLDLPQGARYVNH